MTDISVFDRIGGDQVIHAVVEDFYDRVLADPQLAAFFVGTNIARQKSRQCEFFHAALGGPRPYRGASIRSAHRGRGIENAHFDKVAQHLAASLSGAGVPDDLVDTVIEAIAPLRSEIATGSS